MTLSAKLTAIKEAISGSDPRAVAALGESELRFRQVTENIREVFFLIDTEMTRMFYVSPGCSCTGRRRIAEMKALIEDLEDRR